MVDDKPWVKVEKKDGSPEKKPFRRGYQGNKPRGGSTTTIDQKKFEGSTPELKVHYFDVGPNQADEFKSTMKKLIIIVGIKYSSEVSCSIELMTSKPPMTNLPKKPVLLKMIADGTLTDITIAVPEEYVDLYNE